MIWHQDRYPSLTQTGRHALGMWLTFRKLATSAWMPGQKWRRDLRGRIPFWFVFDFPLVANQTLEKRNTLTTAFIWIASMISTAVGGTPSNPGTRLQVIDIKSRRRMNVMGFNDTNFAGNAQHPFIQRRPYRFVENNTILARMVNLQNSANTAQLVFYGVMD